LCKKGKRHRSQDPPLQAGRDTGATKRAKPIGLRGGSQAFWAWRRRNVGTSKSSAGTSGLTSRTFCWTSCTTFAGGIGGSSISRPAFQVFGRNDCFGRAFFLLASLKPAA